MPGLLIAIGLGALCFIAVRRYLREWRARLFGRNGYAVVQSVTIGGGSGENKEPDRATTIIDGYGSEVDIVLDGLVTAGDHIRPGSASSDCVIAVVPS